jgi:FtsP/CotA-like multicopper oxidase with cupredoxin domain
MIHVQVGDRLIVHFTNNLPEPSTIHWHGLRIPIAMDGVPGYSQPHVEPGESFVYDFIVPDAGIYWYHPHVMSATQVGYGLYGAFLVDDPSETETVAVADELVILLSDIMVTDDGMLGDPHSGGSAGMAFGREGNHVLVNGRKKPRLVARAGAPQRWRIINAAKSRYYDLDLGKGFTFTKIGGDGGLLEYSVEQDFLVLGAGERADVIVTPRGAPGQELVLRSELHNRGYGSTEYRFGSDLVAITIADAPELLPVPLPDVRRTIVPFSTVGATDVRLELTLEKNPRDGTFQYAINGAPYWEARPVLAELGETQVWTVDNVTDWSHPLHLHGFFFMVLDERGEPVRPYEWKDTVDVPFKQSVRMVVRFDENRPGTWIFHCHILDHAEGGLLSAVHLGLPESEFQPFGSH